MGFIRKFRVECFGFTGVWGFDPRAGIVAGKALQPLVGLELALGSQRSRR